MNEVLKAIKSRRSVRAYTEQQISQEDLNAILEAATYAPSGMNYQTWHSQPFRMPRCWKN
jgi:nitroreductase